MFEYCGRRTDDDGRRAWVKDCCTLLLPHTRLGVAQSGMRSHSSSNINTFCCYGRSLSTPEHKILDYLYRELVYYRTEDVSYDGQNGSFFYFDTNSQFRIPNSEFRITNSEFRIMNSEFRIPNSAFRIPHFEKKSCVWKFCFWRCHIRVRSRGGARDLKLEQFKQ